jgi:hypothetical protein
MFSQIHSIDDQFESERLFQAETKVGELEQKENCIYLTTNWPGVIQFVNFNWVINIIPRSIFENLFLQKRDIRNIFCD